MTATGIDKLKSGRYRARYYDADGNRQGRTFDTSREAKDWLRLQQVAVAAGTHVAASAGRITLAEFAAERLPAWRKHRATTRAQVEQQMRCHVLPVFGHLTIGQIKPRHVEDWVALKSMKLAPSTVHTCFSWFRRLMKEAVAARLIPSSPCDGIELPEKHKAEVRPLSLSQVEAVTSAMHAAHPELATIVTVAAWSGLRSGEVLGLRRHRVDLLGRRGDDGARRAPSIRVAEQLQYIKGPPQLVPPKTRRSERRVPIPQVLVDALAAHMAVYPVEPEGFLFTGRTGQPIRRPRLNEVWNDAVKAAGLPAGTTFHHTRHTYASLLIEAGESVKVVSARLGHASAVETLETYAHLWPDSDEYTVAALNATYERFRSPRGHERAV